MNTIKLIIYSFVLIFFYGCASTSYVLPENKCSKEDFSIVVNKGYDQVWENLIKYSADTFFGIDNYEKDSGLLTLSFYSTKASDFVTGGYLLYEDLHIQFSGDYVDFLQVYRYGKLKGKMNVVISKIDDNKTKVTINVLYIFTVPPTINSSEIIWTFNTGNCCTINDLKQNKGVHSLRTICPTYKAESTILESLK